MILFLYGPYKYHVLWSGRFLILAQRSLILVQTTPRLRLDFEIYESSVQRSYRINGHA